MMFTPNTPKTDKENAAPEWHEPFPVPQTIPGGWDLSGLNNDTESVPAKIVDTIAED